MGLPVFFMGSRSDFRTEFYILLLFSLLVIFPLKHFVFKSRHSISYRDVFSILYGYFVTSMSISYPRGYELSGILFINTFLFLSYVFYLVYIISNERKSHLLPLITVVFFHTFFFSPGSSSYYLSTLIYLVYFIIEPEIDPRVNQTSLRSDHSLLSLVSFWIPWLLILFPFITIFYSGFTLEAINYTVRFQAGLLMFLLAFRLAAKKHLQYLIFFMVFSALINSLYIFTDIFHQFHSIYDLLFFQKRATIAGVNTGILGSYFVLILGLSLSLTLIQRKAYLIIIAALVSLLFLYLLIISWSRSALPYPIIGFFIFLLFSYANFKKKIHPIISQRIFFLLLSFFAIFTPAVLIYIFYKFFGSSLLASGLSFEIRLVFWQIIIQQIPEFFFTGIGEINLRYIYQLPIFSYLDPSMIHFVRSNSSLFLATHSHNLFLQLLTQYGILFLAGSALLFFFPMYIALKKRFNLNYGYYHNYLLLGIFIGIYSLIFHSMFHYTLHITGIPFFLLLGFLINALISGPKNEPLKPKNQPDAHTTHIGYKRAWISFAFSTILLVFSGYHASAIYHFKEFYKPLTRILYWNHLHVWQMHRDRVDIANSLEKESLVLFFQNVKNTEFRLNHLLSMYPEDSQLLLLKADSEIYHYKITNNRKYLNNAYLIYQDCSSARKLPSICSMRMADVIQVLAPEQSVLKDFYIARAHYHDPFHMLNRFYD